MYQVKFTTAYKKAYKLMKKRGLDISLLDEVADLLRQGRLLEERYRDHGLTGDLSGFREWHIVRRHFKRSGDCIVAAN